MKKFLLSCLMLVSIGCASHRVSIPVVGDQALAKWIRPGIFKAMHETAPGQFYGGTAFCVPGTNHLLMTAAHVPGEGTMVEDAKGNIYEAAIIKSDSAEDVAILSIEEPVCGASVYEWGPEPEVGEKAYLYGFGGLAAKPVFTEGDVASEDGLIEMRPHTRLVNLNALKGHSGSPIFNSAKQIVGMLVGGITDEAGDEMDSFVPVTVLRRMLK
jgi:S1-C subfamily serine protease